MNKEKGSMLDMYLRRIVHACILGDSRNIQLGQQFRLLCQVLGLQLRFLNYFKEFS